MNATGRSRRSEDRPRLLLFFTHADHPHRDPVCATLCWLAESVGALFECYFDSTHSGMHFGGGHPGWRDAADLRGPTAVGGRHIETLLLLFDRFACEAACLGPALHEPWLRASGIPIHSRSGNVATFYGEVLDALGCTIPETVLVVGDGGRPQGIPLAPYAFPEIVARRMLAVADHDEPALSALAAGRTFETLWVLPDRAAARTERGRGSGELCPATIPRTVAALTAWMAERWDDGDHGFLLGDPELVGRWAPTAVRNRWLPLYGIPQLEVIDLMAKAISRRPLVHGRQHQDADFFRLSELGTALQVIDPGSPPFPVVSELAPAPGRPTATPATTTRAVAEQVKEASGAGQEPSGAGQMESTDGREPSGAGQIGGADEPSDEQLRAWAHEGRVLSTLLFWTGMIRELQSIFPLADVLSLTRLQCGLVLTTESYRYMEGTPLGLIGVPWEAGGLSPGVEPLLTDTGCGVLLAGHAPPRRFATSLAACTAALAESLSDPRLVPRGWWAHLDAALVPHRLTRVGRFSEPPGWRLRYRSRELALREPPALEGHGEPSASGEPLGRAVSGPPAAGSVRGAVRQTLRASPVGRYVAPWRPYDGYRPGPPSRSVLEAVADAGFAYAITKSAFGPVPRVVDLPGDLVVFNQTAGRWDGWSPFVTVNGLSDLCRAERRLLHRKAPGWLVGALDTCLWAFTGPVWERGSDLHAICRWAAEGGSTGALVNVTPATVARYARVLKTLGQAEQIAPV